MALGVRFRPTDEQLVCYLLKFVSCKNYSCDNIQIEDVYANKKSWQNEDGEKVRYFFTQLKKKKSNGRRFIRTVIGGGLWKGLDGSKSVNYKGSKLVGSKKSYRYQYEGYQVNNVVWTMKEYSLDEKILKRLRQRRLIQHEDVVLCCVKFKINVHAHDHHKELGDYKPMEIPSGNEVVGAMDSSLLNQFTSSEHNNAFHELQQDQNSEQLINQVQNIDEMAPSAQNHNDYVVSYLEKGTTNFHDSCPVYPFTSCEQYEFQLQQDQNVEQVIVQEQNIEEMVPSTQYHIDDVTSYSEEGTTNFQDYCVDHCDTFSSTLADLLNDVGTQPQLPIYIDESGYDYQFRQQGSTSMVLNEGNIDAVAFVSDQWSTCCEEQVQNLEEAAPITFTEPTASLVINSDECFPMEGLFDTDDFIAADLSWASDLFD